VEKPEKIGLVIHAEEGLGLLHRLTGVIAEHQGDIISIAIIDNRAPDARIYFEIELPTELSKLTADLEKLAVVHSVAVVKSLERIYGKRIIIMGGGAQVGQVAIGAVSEADRHNIRGEHISVDTIPGANRSWPTPCRSALAARKGVGAAGALMGGDIEQAVLKCGEQACW
jgi:energy-converting hydrogenase B subunit Q